MKRVGAVGIVAIAMFVVGALAGAVLYAITIDRGWNDKYATLEQVLGRSYWYKIEYLPSWRPSWLREAYKDRPDIFYTNDFALRLVTSKDGKKGLEVFIKNAAAVRPYLRNEFDVISTPMRFDVPLIFPKKEKYFIRITFPIIGKVIVDTVAEGGGWFSLLIDPNYLKDH